MVDRDLVLRKLSELDEYQNQVQEFKGITVKQYREDWKKQRIVERTLQMMIETCLDIANHIVADQGYRVPVSYADTFKVLGENNVLGKRLVDRMRKDGQVSEFSGASVREDRSRNHRRHSEKESRRF